MDTQTSKKRTAVVAVATAAAMLLTGTFAWTLATDDTVLNPFSDTDEGAYGAELEENFDPANPWERKEVYVKNTADNPVIVRVRLEEFYDLTSRVGSEYGVAEGYLNGDEGSSAIFTTDGLTGGAADSSTKLANAISLKFGTNVAVLTADNAASIPEGIEWLIDPVDGWCYYTRALLAGESTGFLLEDVDFFDDNFNYSQPYDLDYKINVRLQAISADLEDFGSHIKDDQWTNVGYINEAGEDVTDDPTDQGRIIAADDRADDYEITTDTPITDNALTLVVNISNAANIYANDDTTVAVRVASAQELVDAIDTETVHSVLLTSDITFGAGDWPIDAYENKLIDLGDYKITVSSDFNDGHLFSANSGAKLIVRNGRIHTCREAVMVDENSTAVLENLSIYYEDNYPADPLCYGRVVDMVGNGSLVINNCDITSEYNAIRAYGDADNIEINNTTINADHYAIATYLANDSITINNSKLYSDNAVIAPVDSNDIPASGTSFNINNSELKSENGQYVMWLYDGCKTVIKNSSLTNNAEGMYVITENHNNPPESTYLENCVLEGSICVYKPSVADMTLKDCTINAVGMLDPTTVGDGKTPDGYTALGLCIRGGNVTLDNVNVTVSQGTFPDTGSIWTDAQVRNRYNQLSKNNGLTANFEAIQIDLNHYEDINLNIIGGSYTATYQGKDGSGNLLPLTSVFVMDNSTACIYYSGSEHGDSHDYKNTITIDGAAFDPGFTFADSYINTTVTVK